MGIFNAKFRDTRTTLLRGYRIFQEKVKGIKGIRIPRPPNGASVRKENSSTVKAENHERKVELVIA